MKNKVIIILVSVAFLCFSWYFLLKKSDYVVKFKTKAATGTIYQGILDWTKDRENKNGEKFIVTESKTYSHLIQTLTSNSGTVRYDWEIEPINDSITAITVGVSDPDHKFKNRISAPFGSEFISAEVAKIKAFKAGLDEHLSTFKIGKIYEGQTESIFVAYISLESVLQEKAQTMIGNDNIIMAYLFNNKIKILGKPILEVEKLDLKNEKIKFNYCFPIDKNTNYISDKKVKFKTIPAKKGLKIDYFGNYRTSDRAWFQVFDHAKAKNINLDFDLTEHYLNNPFNGGKEIEWKTEILIPYKK